MSDSVVVVVLFVLFLGVGRPVIFVVIHFVVVVVVFVVVVVVLLLLLLLLLSSSLFPLDLCPDVTVLAN